MYLKDKGKYDRGRAYALKEIAKHGDSCLDRLETEADNAFDFDDFDHGILSALREHRSRWRPRWRIAHREPA